jgi:hypothetical protein
MTAKLIKSLSRDHLPADEDKTFDRGRNFNTELPRRPRTARVFPAGRGTGRLVAGRALPPPSPDRRINQVGRYARWKPSGGGAREVHPVPDFLLLINPRDSKA